MRGSISDVRLYHETTCFYGVWTSDLICTSVGLVVLWLRLGSWAIGRLLHGVLKCDNFLGFSRIKQCQDVKIEHSMYMQLGVFWNSLLIYKAIFPSSQMPNELSVAQNNVATFLDQRGVIFRTYLGVVDDMAERNPEKRCY